MPGSEGFYDRWPFASMGSPNDVLEPKGAIAQEISHLLGRVKVDEGINSFGGEFPALPALPGLSVKDFGLVSLPLCKEQSDILVTKCTQQDDQVWTLTPSQVAMTNPEWEIEIQELCKSSGDKLGYEDIALQCVLSKVIVYGEGGHLNRKQDKSEDDGVVAKLLLQLPSKYTGGDIVVCSEKMKVPLRYDMGKANRTVAFKPQYVVYATGASCSVEEVTNGYRVMVEYLLCLPPAPPVIGGKTGKIVLRAQLAEAIKKLKGEDDPETMGESHKGTGVEPESMDEGDARLAFMLSKSYTALELESMGSERLCGIDRARLLALIDANAFLPPDKKFKFYLAELQYTIAHENGFWNEIVAEERVSWYLLSGEKLCDESSIQWTSKLNHMNPDKENLGQLWGGGRFGEYKRCAIVVWPVFTDMLNTRKLMGEFAAIACILADKPVDVSKLRQLLDFDISMRGSLLTKDTPVLELMPMPLTLCPTFCKVVAELGDVVIAQTFFKNYFPRLKEKREIIPWLAHIMRNFEWRDVGSSFISAITYISCDDVVELTVNLAAVLNDNPLAQESLTMIAVEKLLGKSHNDRTNSTHLGLLWRNAIVCEDPQVFRAVENIFKQVDEEFLSPVVGALSKCVGGSSLPEHRAALAAVVFKRSHWLASEIAAIEEPFSPGIPVGDFPGAAAVKAFLQSPRNFFVLQGCFPDITAARAHTVLLRKKITAPVVITATGSGRQARVEILKAGKMPELQKKNVTEYKAELSRIAHLLEPDENSNIGNTCDTGNKRLRME